MLATRNAPQIETLPPGPFRSFYAPPEVERGTDICHETGRMWWNRSGPVVAGDIRRLRVSAMRGFRLWRCHLDEM